MWVFNAEAEEETVSCGRAKDGLTKSERAKEFATGARRIPELAVSVVVPNGVCKGD